jgi:hypothetical protein
VLESLLELELVHKELLALGESGKVVAVTVFKVHSNSLRTAHYLRRVVVDCYQPSVLESLLELAYCLTTYGCW